MLKSRIVDVLGAGALLLPRALDEALVANARAKYCFALLQAAVTAAEHPGQPVVDLAAERRSAELADVELDAIPGASRCIGPGVYAVPQIARIEATLTQALDAMLQPLALAGGADTACADAARARRDALLARLRAGPGERIDRGYVAGVTAIDTKRGDSLHRLVMDLHKALNRLQSRIAVSHVDGAAVHGLARGDAALVAAFMRGLNATAPLKFEHPGLATTATRRGRTLILQNDIGTTDAHVLIVEIEGRSCTVRYTDVHRKRARFFASLFEPWRVEWQDMHTTRVAGLADDAEFHVCTGSHHARSRAEQERYLAFLGSRIVFLIDWNRARKRLQQFVSGAEAVELLRYAAREDLGHRGFLQAGGEALLCAAIDSAGRGAIRYGQRLDEVLGPEAAAAFLRFVLRTCSQALRAGRSPRLLRDEIEAELRQCLQSAEQTALALACDHAALIAEIAGVVRDGVLRLARGAARDPTAAQRAKQWETRADGLLNRLRDMSRATPGARVYRDITEYADDGADSLEEAAFLLGLAPGARPGDALGMPLQRLASAALAAAHEYVKVVECAAFAQHGAARADINDFLEAVERAADLEHATDACEREVIAALVTADSGPGQLRLYGDLAGRLEESADALSRSALMLRDHLLSAPPTG